MAAILRPNPARLPFPTDADISAVEWTSDIASIGSLALGVSRWRVNFVGLETRGPSGESALSVNTASFQTDNDAVAPDGIRPSMGSWVETGCCLIWSTQEGRDQNFTTVLLWDNSAGSFVNLTTPGGDYTPNDTLLMGQAADFLYVGWTAKPLNPSIKVQAGSQLAVGGGPLLVSYWNGGWASSPVLEDRTSAFSVDGSAYSIAKCVLIEVGPQDDWVQTTVNGITRYWMRLRFTTNPTQAPIVTRISGMYDIDGAEMTVPISDYPNWARTFQDIDGSGNTGIQITARDYRGIHAALPETVRWRFSRVGDVLSPPGNLWRDSHSGLWRSLANASDGTGYTKWRVSMEIGGVWRDIAFMYRAKARSAKLDAAEQVINLVQEFGEGGPLSDNVSEIHYSGFRAYDATSGVWHDLMDWYISFEYVGSLAGAGFHTHRKMGALTSTAGIAGEQAVNRKLLTGLTYERGDTLAPLVYVATQNVGAGSATYNGPFWEAPGGYPWVMQEANRGFYIAHPSATAPAVLTYTAPYSGTFRFVGDFCRASPTGSPQGDGTAVSVTARTTLYSGVVSPLQTVVDPDNPFSGTGNLHFDVSTFLDAGETVRFSVSALASISFDATAFRVAVSFESDLASVMEWCPSLTSEVQNEPTWETHRLGDNYELVIAQGPDDYLRRYTMEFRKKTPAEAIEIEDWLRARGRRAFSVEDPDSGELMKVRVNGPIRRRPDGQRFRTVTLTIKEIREP